MACNATQRVNEQLHVPVPTTLGINNNELGVYLTLSTSVLCTCRHGPLAVRPILLVGRSNFKILGAGSEAPAYYPCSHSFLELHIVEYTCFQNKVSPAWLNFCPLLASDGGDCVARQRRAEEASLLAPSSNVTSPFKIEAYLSTIYWVLRQQLQCMHDCISAGGLYTTGRESSLN